MKISIGKATNELGVSTRTLRRWEEAGKITVDRTPKGHRRYDLDALLGIIPRKTLDDNKIIPESYIDSLLWEPLSCETARKLKSSGMSPRLVDSLLELYITKGIKDLIAETVALIVNG